MAELNEPPPTARRLLLDALERLSAADDILDVAMMGGQVRYKGHTFSGDAAVILGDRQREAALVEAVVGLGLAWLGDEPADRPPTDDEGESWEDRRVRLNGPHGGH